MERKIQERQELSRRSFIRGSALAAVGTAAVGLTACTAQESPDVNTRVDIKWDKETEVLVVGFGGAGGVAAVSAFEAGAEVLVIEKAPIEGGGTSRMSGGFVTVVSDVDQAVTYLKAASKGLTPDEVLQAWAEEGTKTMDWLDEHGIQYMELPPTMGADFPNFPGAEGIHGIDMCDEREMMNTGGQVFLKWATDYLNTNGIELSFDTTATRFIQDPSTKEILGVRALSAGAEITIRAKKAVILTSGGFAADQEMLGTYIRPYPVGMTGWPLDTGDGIKLLQGVGAGLSHMSLPCANGITFAIPGQISNRWGMGFNNGGAFIFVNRTGKRFTCENPNDFFGHRSYMEFGTWDQSSTQNTADYRDIPFYAIFDEANRIGGPIFSNGNNIGVTTISKELGGIEDDWSADNSKEVEAGWILKADTINELCQAINKNSAEEGFAIDPAVLQETVDTYNHYCTEGYDPDFKRAATIAGMNGSEAPNLIPLASGPFYAIRVIPALYSTCGGATKNGKGQVLNPWGEVIPRLYVAGVIGHSAAQVYSTFGQNWGDIMNFGRISGRNAAAETTMA